MTAVVPVKDFSGNYIINGVECYLQADGTVVRWDEEEENFTFKEKRIPMPIHDYTTVAYFPESYFLK